MSLTYLVVLALATWRLSSLLVEEDGPFGVFRSLRAFAGAGEFSQHGLDATRLTPQEVERVMMRAGRPESFLAGLLSCVWCISVWVGAFWVILAVFLPAFTFYAALVFALSAAAIFLQESTRVH